MDKKQIIWLVKDGDGGCSDPDCCGGASYWFTCWSEKALAEAHAKQHGGEVEEVILDTGNHINPE